MRYWPRGLGIAKCPFYLTDSRLTISCEAPAATGANRVRLCFDSEAVKNAYLRERCICMEPKCGYYEILANE